MKKHILIIEDDILLGDVLTQKLTHEGYQVTLETDGAQGLQQMTKLLPDLVLLDIILPTMNGYEVLEARQKNPRLMTIPIVIISNSGQPVEINRALALGIKDYLVKAQFDPDELLGKIRPLLESNVLNVADPKKRLSNIKVFWVEDDAFLSELLGAKLKREGCISIYAKDGEEAIKLLANQNPDIILLDLILPGMNGIEVLKHIKADPRTAQVPVIVFSNLGQDKDKEETIRLGAVKHLIKAEHDPDDIVHEILSVVKK